MNIVRSITTCLKKYASFKGRATRSEYWWFYLFYIVLMFVGTVLDDQFYDLPPDDLGYFSGGVSLLLLIPSIAVHVRRFHDISRSGWWVLLVLCSVLGILIVPDLGLQNSWFEVVAYVFAFAMIIVNFSFLIRRSDPFDNKYGPGPFGEKLKNDGGEDNCFSSSIPPVER